jgi:ribosomal protein L3 glutamine methyltransferase
VNSNQQAAESLKTITDFVRWGASRFSAAGLHFGHGTDNPVDEALFLVRYALNLGHDMPPEFYGARLTPDEKSEILALFQRRIDERIPAAYITGEAWFAGLPFTVDSRVIVPRSPIAELIENGFEPWLNAGHVGRVLDLCTGSGCIAIACALAFPGAQVDAVELSPDALEVARMNVARHAVEHQVALLEGDLWEPVADRRYALILSNPPYVSDRDMEILPQEYGHEPDMALRSGPHGLDAVGRILESAGAHLEPGGLLVVETGASASAVEAAWPELQFTWVDFGRGGSGVFILGEADLNN